MVKGIKVSNLYKVRDNLLCHGYIKNKIYVGISYDDKTISNYIYLENKYGKTYGFLYYEVEIIGRGLLVEKWH